jgi:hypothetical protein
VTLLEANEESSVCWGRKMATEFERAKIDEWVDQLSECKALSENDMKQLCDIVWEILLFPVPM